MPLVISRKDKEPVLIGENIKITALIDHRDCVKLSIDAQNEPVIIRKKLDDNQGKPL